MHNNVMAAGSRDRPPMLAPGRYPQWCSRFLRYVDTRPNGEALRKCILSGPYKPSIVLVHVVKATDNSPAVAEHTTLETPANMSSENIAHFLAEKEAIHLILTGIRDDIYSTVDACQTAQEMWVAIERLQQGESLNIQDVKTNLFWEFGKFTSNDGESMESYYTRFYKLMNEMIRNNLTVTIMQILLTSTLEVYGDPLVHPQDESYWGNVNPIGVRTCYDERKRVVESLMFEYHRQHGIEVRIARIFNTYGPRMNIDDSRVINNFIAQAICNAPLTVQSPGTHTRKLLLCLLYSEFTMIQLDETVKEEEAYDKSVDAQQ
nr:UDP-glucuronic acid decarboxylase 6-like [Tanacetum cinerariifolium]